jgi:hypothetical protein
VAIKGQEEGRRLEQFTDKFGRVYEANIEISTGDPCENLRPVGWTAPAGPEWCRGMLIPPLDDREVVRMVPRLQRARKGYQVEIDFARWLQKWDDADEAFQKKLADFAHGMAKGSTMVLQLIENPPAELRKIIGNGPRNTPRAFIQAAAAGNKWAIGETETVPPKAQLLLDEIQPLITGKRNRTSIGFDPLADDDADEPGAGVAVGMMADPLDGELEGLLDIEEQFDPKATGGTKVPPPKRRKRQEVEA